MNDLSCGKIALAKCVPQTDLLLTDSEEGQDFDTTEDFLELAGRCLKDKQGRSKDSPEGDEADTQRI